MNRLDNANSSFAPAEQGVVAKPLSELPRQEKRQITTELMRIHNLVNAVEDNLHKHSDKDKADVKRLG